MSKDESKETAEERKEKINDSSPQENENVTLAKAEHEELLRKVNEFAQLQERLLRSAADFENAKKRLLKEKEEYFKFALESLVFDLLQVLDNFEFALSHLGGNDEKTKPVRDGLLLVQKQLISILSERGLKRIESVGKIFDPHLHEAVGHIVDPVKDEGIILEEFQTGYEFGGRLLRPSKVKISVKEEKAAEEKAEELT